MSIIDGNRNNKDSFASSAELSGAYFGVAGAVRALAQVGGDFQLYYFATLATLNNIDTINYTL